MLSTSTIRFENNFGVIGFQVSDTTTNTAPINISAHLDQSGSMSDVCDNQQRTQWQYAKFATELAFRKAQENKLGRSIRASLKMFDHHLKPIFPLAKNESFNELTQDSVHLLATKMASMGPEGNTDLGMVIQDITKMANQLKEDMVSIILTDGYATCGITNSYPLIDMAEDIPENVQLVLIGYGTGHDNRLLSGIHKSRPNTTYVFISEFEDTSIALSEIIYNLLYCVGKQAHIVVENGEIYDWMSDSWSKEVKISNLVASNSKTYTVRSDDPTQFKAKLVYRDAATGEQQEIQLPEPIHGESLTKEQFQHKTMRLLYEAGTIEQGRYRQRDLKKKLTALMKEMKDYMDANGLREDKLLRMLCDDIFMCHESVGQMNGQMYINDRHTSQGTQRAYSVRISRKPAPRQHYNDPLAIPTTQRCLSLQVSHMQRIPITIRIKTLGETTLTLSDIGMEDDMEDVMDMISELEGPSPDEIYLALRGREVDYFGTVESNGIKDGDELAMVLGGGGKRIIARCQAWPEDDDDEDGPGDLMNCSMAPRMTPRVRQLPMVQQEDEEPIMQHEMSSIDDSPYADPTRIAFMRGTSLGTQINEI
jgi:hypothetical protein